MSLCILQHEKGSLDMFEHLVKENGLEEEMKKEYELSPDDLVFIKEMIGGPLKTDAAQDQEVPVCPANVNYVKSQ